MKLILVVKKKWFDMIASGDPSKPTFVIVLKGA